MQFRSLSLVTGLALASLSTTASAIFPLLVIDESPVGAIDWTYSSGNTATWTVTAPLLCANTGIPLATAIQLNPIYGTFVFGATSAAPTVQQPVQGISFFNFVNPKFVINGDSSLVCYALDTAGRRKPTRDLFVDNFEQSQGFDSSVTLRVASLPAAPFNYYKYYVDVSIPAVDRNSTFIVRDGMDTTPFDPNQGGWCEASSVSATDCAPTQLGSIAFQSPVTPTSPLPDATGRLQFSPGQSLQRRFVVYRKFRGGTLPNTGAPLALAALFSPTNLFENKLDNNVSAGFGAISDFPASIDTVATNLAGMIEGGGLSNISFTLHDDTGESVGALLGADIMIDFNGSPLEGKANCGSSTPISVPPVTRACTFNIAPYLANFATDSAPNTFVNGVYANMVINASDSHHQPSFVVLPLHVASTDNDAPVFGFSADAPSNASNGNTPTLTCSLASQMGPACNANKGIPGFITNVAPGPTDAVDELISQTAGLAPDTTNGHGGNIFCVLEQVGDIFSPFGTTYPHLTPSGPASSYNLFYSLNGNIGSAVCFVVVHDGGTMPAGQNPMGTSKPFRILVTP